MRSMAALLRSSVRLVSLRMIRMSQAPATTPMRTDLAPAGDGSMLTVLSGRSDLSVTAKKSEKKRNIAGIGLLNN